MYFIYIYEKYIFTYFYLDTLKYQINKSISLLWGLIPQITGFWKDCTDAIRDWAGDTGNCLGGYFKRQDKKRNLKRLKGAVFPPPQNSHSSEISNLFLSLFTHALSANTWVQSVWYVLHFRCNNTHTNSQNDPIILSLNMCHPFWKLPYFRSTAKV